MDDDPQIGLIATEFLRDAGFDAESAPSGSLAVAAERERPADALLCDVFIGETYGPDLVALLRRTRPGLPVLYMSGSGPLELDLELDERTGFLPKPFTADVLAERIEELIAA